MPDGEVTTYTYDDLSRLTGLTEVQGSTTLFSQTYVLNDDGTRASSHEVQLQGDGSTVTVDSVWAYDALQRLTGEVVTSTATNESYSNNYSYDLDNNRTQSIHVGPVGGADETITYVYNGDDELKSQSSTLSGTTLNTYDANGSLTTSLAGGVTTTYTYDARNKMVGFADGTNTATYVYDDDGDRVAETANGVTTLYLTDTQNPTRYDQPIEQKSSASAAPNITYILGDRILGQANGGGQVSYLLIDGHGSTQQLTNVVGVVTSAMRYTVFGDALNFVVNDAGTVILYGGDAVYDPVSGLYLHGNGVRPTLGFEFIQRDTYDGANQDPITIHKYLYANAAPINVNDPSGRLGEELFGDVVIANAEATEILGADAAQGYAGQFIAGVQEEEFAQAYFVNAIETGASNSVTEGALDAAADVESEAAADLSGQTITQTFKGALNATVDVTNGAARVSIDYLHGVDASQFTEILDFAKANGATSAVIDSGSVVNDTLAEDLAARAASGRTLFGGIVKAIPGGLFPQFQIIFTSLP